MKTRLKEIRTTKGLTIKKLSELSDVSSSQISRIEREERTMNAETIVKICKALKVSSDYFLGLDDDYLKKDE